MPAHERPFDLVSLGEPLLRLSPPRWTPIRQADRFDAVLAGSQMNVAADFARLGGRTALITQLPENELGGWAMDALRSYGVDTSLIRLIPNSRLGSTYVEFSAAPRTPLAVYDRANSAASRIGPDDFNWEEIAARSGMVFTDGIFPGLSPSCLLAAEWFVGAADKAGCTVCFDVNYREHLWTPGQAREAWLRILPHVHVLVTNPDVSKVVFGFDPGDDRRLMELYAEQFGCRTVCLTRRRQLRGSRGAFTSVALSEGIVHESPRVRFDVVDRYGTGDAWFAGFLHALSRGLPVGEALEFANWTLALAHTGFGDVICFSADDVTAAMTRPAGKDVRR